MRLRFIFGLIIFWFKINQKNLKSIPKPLKDTVIIVCNPGIPEIPAIFWDRNPGAEIAAAPGSRYQHSINFLNKMYSTFGFVPLFFFIILMLS
jgi:hypothetical protein